MGWDGGVDRHSCRGLLESEGKRESPAVTWGDRGRLFGMKFGGRSEATEEEMGSGFGGRDFVRRFRHGRAKMEQRIKRSAFGRRSVEGSF